MQLIFTPIGERKYLYPAGATEVTTGTEAELLQHLRDTIVELDLLDDDDMDNLDTIPDAPGQLPELVRWFNHRCEEWAVELVNN